jgi:transcriptional regulator with XRE-family HTH domain
MARRRVPIRQSDLVGRFAEALRSARVARGMSQADLARSAQVSVSYVSRLEGGQVAPGIDLAERIAESIAVPLAELLPSKEVPDPMPQLKEQARKLLESLIRHGDAQAFTQLNPIMSLILESATRRA